MVEHEGKILMCRRGIEPCKGLWTVPAGFLEMGESTAAGAARETWEEANARVEVGNPEGPAMCPAHVILSVKPEVHAVFLLCRAGIQDAILAYVATKFALLCK